jgi:hypothetical protein
MTSTFTTVNLKDSRVLVSGTDQFGVEGKQVLDGSQWNQIHQNAEFDQAEASFTAAVEEFFAPIMDAAEKFETVVKRKEQDPEDYVVLREAVEPTPGDAGHLIKLSHDSKVLRFIADGKTDRLVWVNDELEILEVDDALPFTIAQATDTVDPATVVEVEQG